MKSTQGFTLIELLIVIAIIGILAAVLIPNLLNARKAANNTAAQSTLRNAITAAEASRAAGTPITQSTGTTATAVDCSNAAVLNTTLPDQVTACQVAQNANGTVGYATSSNGISYQWDGKTLIPNSAASLPTLP